MKTSKRLQQNTSTKCNNALKESHCMIKGDLSQRFIMRSFSSFSLSAIRVLVSAYLGLPRSLRKHPKNVGDLGSIPGLGRSPGRGHGNPLQHSCLENPAERGAWRPAVHGVAEESDTTEHARLSRWLVPSV